MRFFAAVAVGILMSLFAVAPASAAVTVNITMEPKYLVNTAIRPVVTLAGAPTGYLYFRRYDNSSCSGSGSYIGTVGPVGNGDHTGPNLQTSNPGAYWLRVMFDASGTTYDKLSECRGYLVQRKVAITAQLAKNIVEAGEKVEPAITLGGETADAGGQVELGRWSIGGCGPAKAVSAGILPVNNGQVQGTANLQEGGLGLRSFRAVYSGDTKNSEAASECREYTVGVYIRGKVFHDTDGNGVMDQGEPGLPAVTITLKKPQGTSTATTNNTGAYDFFVTATGAYTLTQTSRAGYDFTTAETLTVQISGSPVGNQNFGQVELPSTLLPLPSPTTDGPTQALETPEGGGGGGGFAVIRLLALGMVVVAALVLLGLVFAARIRREDDPF